MSNDTTSTSFNLPIDDSNHRQGSTTGTTTATTTTVSLNNAKKNWGKLNAAVVSFSDRIMNEGAAVSSSSVTTGSGGGGTTTTTSTTTTTTIVHPSMERMATKRHLNHQPVFSNVRVSTSEQERLKSKSTSKELLSSSSSSLTGGKGGGGKGGGKKQKDDDTIPPSYILYPWNPYNKLWWSITSAAAIATVLNEPFGIAFTPVGNITAPTSIIEYCLLSIFICDILVQLNTAYYDHNDHVITNRHSIAIHYVKCGTFKIDILGVFPFYLIALACSGSIGEDTKMALLLSLFRLTRLVRLYRVKQLFDILSYSSKISLLNLTLIRNLGFAISWSHFAACTMYYISRLYSDPDNTWNGDTTGQTIIQKYLTAMYWSITTFATVGYGDWSAVNSAEQIWCSIYMLTNIVAQAWIIGSITLLVVKNDEKTGLYREALSKLGQFSAMHGFDRDFYKRLKTSLKLSFESVDVQDEEVLMHFPSSVRRRILRRLYMPSLLKTSLMKDVRQQFVDQFLSACKVEVFSPGEELLQRGMNSPDLYLLVSGIVDVLSVRNATDRKDEFESKAFGGGTSIGESEYMFQSGLRVTRQLEPGEFINEISFFTESHQANTIKTVNVVQVLTISREAYKSICADHPCSAGIVLQNLLNKVQELLGMEPDKNILLSKPLAAMRAGTSFRTDEDLDVENTGNDEEDNDDDDDEVAEKAIMKVNNKAAMASLQELVKIHIEKLRDDLTTRFLFAASRGDIATVSLMCDQGFDPNCMDYDNRTALMVSSMKGQTNVVRKLIEEYQADVNLVDVNGGSALYEAAKHGHDATIDVLIRNNADLCMSESLAASTLCQLVFDGDATTLRRLLKANINVNAADYDRRTAAHVAAAEGNLVAFKILVEFGCNIYAKDRWNNMIEDEAKKSLNGSKLMEYLKEIQTQTSTTINVLEDLLIPST